MKIMAIDYGDSRTGLAICDKFEILASPMGVIEEKDFMTLVKKISLQINENNVEEVIVGYPKNMNGSIGDRAKKTELLAENLRKITNVPIFLWDERNTTKLANMFLNETNIKRSKKKKVIDAIAATIILESYINLKKERNLNADNENIRN